LEQKLFVHLSLLLRAHFLLLISANSHYTFSFPSEILAFQMVKIYKTSLAQLLPKNYKQLFCPQIFYSQVKKRYLSHSQYLSTYSKHSKSHRLNKEHHFSIFLSVYYFYPHSIVFLYLYFDFEKNVLVLYDQS